MTQESPRWSFLSVMISGVGWEVSEVMGKSPVSSRAFPSRHGPRGREDGVYHDQTEISPYTFTGVFHEFGMGVADFPIRTLLT